MNTSVIVGIVIVLAVVAGAGGFIFLNPSAPSGPSGDQPPDNHLLDNQTPDNQPPDNQQQPPSGVGLSFTADSGIKVSGGSVPCIVQLPSGTYMLYYGGSDGIYYASSADGLSFTAGSKLISKGSAGQPDSDSVSSPVLVQFGDNSFKLFYEGVSGSSRVVMSTTSTNGFSFSKESGVRYSGGPTDGGIVSAFDISKENDNFLRMYYVADWNGKNNVRTATSEDGGQTWTFERGNICGDDSAGGAPNTYVDPDIVKLPGGGYKLYTKKGADKIYSFSSSDGVNFTIDSGIRIQASQFSGGVTDLLDPDTIIFPDNSMRVFFGAMGGTPLSPIGIVSATSS